MTARLRKDGAAAKPAIATPDDLRKNLRDTAMVLSPNWFLVFGFWFLVAPNWFLVFGF
jgi:hypothetical protein